MFAVNGGAGRSARTFRLEGEHALTAIGLACASAVSVQTSLETRLSVKCDPPGHHTHHLAMMASASSPRACDRLHGGSIDYVACAAMARVLPRILWTRRDRDSDNERLLKHGACDDLRHHRELRLARVCHNDTHGAVFLAFAQQTSEDQQRSATTEEPERVILLRVGGPHPQTTRFRRLRMVLDVAGRGQTAWVASFRLCDAGAYMASIRMVVRNNVTLLNNVTQMWSWNNEACAMHHLLNESVLVDAHTFHDRAFASTHCADGLWHWHTGPEPLPLSSSYRSEEIAAELAAHPDGGAFLPLCDEVLRRCRRDGCDKKNGSATTCFGRLASLVEHADALSSNASSQAAAALDEEMEARLSLGTIVLNGQDKIKSTYHSRMVHTNVGAHPWKDTLHRRFRRLVYQPERPHSGRGRGGGDISSIRSSSSSSSSSSIHSSSSSSSSSSSQPKRRIERGSRHGTASAARPSHNTTTEHDEPRDFGYVGWRKLLRPGTCACFLGDSIMRNLVNRLHERHDPSCHAMLAQRDEKATCHHPSVRLNFMRWGRELVYRPPSQRTLLPRKDNSTGAGVEGRANQADASPPPCEACAAVLLNIGRWPLGGNYGVTYRSPYPLPWTFDHYAGMVVQVIRWLASFGVAEAVPVAFLSTVPMPLHGGGGQVECRADVRAYMQSRLKLPAHKRPPQWESAADGAQLPHRVAAYNAMARAAAMHLNVTYLDVEPMVLDLLELSFECAHRVSNPGQVLRHAFFSAQTHSLTPRSSRSRVRCGVVCGCAHSGAHYYDPVALAIVQQVERWLVKVL